MKRIGILGLLLYLLGARKKSLLIFKLRGGLGNQLFQIAGVSSNSDGLDFNVLFYDGDVRLNPRDELGASSLEFEIHKLFPKNVIVYRPDYFANQLIKALRRIKSFSYFLQVVDLDYQSPNPEICVTIGKGYLQNVNHVLDIKPTTLHLVFRVTDGITVGASLCAMHIRGSDALRHSEMLLNASYYREGLLRLGAKNGETIDVFTDDPVHAKKICSQLNEYTFNFIEDHNSIAPAALLLQLSMYKKMICSKSTLCWWAAYLSHSRYADSKIISPWVDKLRVEGWIAID
jgi:hypothetical protein